MAKQLIEPKQSSFLPGIRKLPAAEQRRLDVLMEKNSLGKLTDAEREELTAMVRRVEVLVLENAKRLAGEAKHVK